VLGRLIAHVGLEDAGELVALATTEQLAQIFDEELWHSARPRGRRDFRLRPVPALARGHARGGRPFRRRAAGRAAGGLGSTLAFHRHLLVVATDDLRCELTAGDDDAQRHGKSLRKLPIRGIEDYLLIWRGGDGWDCVLSAVLALDRDHHSHMVDLLERCASMSREYIADNGGLYDVLSSDEMLGERSGRRA
jgi:hypothetical protein